MEQIKSYIIQHLVHVHDKGKTDKGQTLESMKISPALSRCKINHALLITPDYNATQWLLVQQEVGRVRVIGLLLGLRLGVGLVIRYRAGVSHENKPGSLNRSLLITP